MDVFHRCPSHCHGGPRESRCGISRVSASCLLYSPAVLLDGSGALRRGLGISPKMFKCITQETSSILVLVSGLLAWDRALRLGAGRRGRHRLAQRAPNSNAPLPVPPGKGSSSISSDVSSSTDPTPTQAQKNVATSEGRHLGFIISCPLCTVLAIFGRQIKCVSQSPVLLSRSTWGS